MWCVSAGLNMAQQDRKSAKPRRSIEQNENSWIIVNKGLAAETESARMQNSVGDFLTDVMAVTIAMWFVKFDVLNMEYTWHRILYF